LVGKNIWLERKKETNFLSSLKDARATTGEIVFVTATHVYHKCQRESCTGLFFSLLSFIVMAFFLDD
jgi:hypothetical protein